MLRKYGWILLVVAVGLGVHFTAQSIIRRGDPENLKGPDIARVARIEAADPARGARVRAGMAKYEATCRLCHHRTGHGGKFTPAIGGRPVEYIEAMLKLYRSGAEVGAMTNLMAPWAKELSDGDIVDLAAYIEILSAQNDAPREAPGKQP
jgi:cytochrome c553